MKKILVLNGSPKKKNSGTMVLTSSFVEGLTSTGEYESELINVSDLNIKPCLGCLGCWGRSPGVCVIKNDDLPMIKAKIEEADIVLLSAPLFFFGLPGQTKILMDRLLGMLNTYHAQTSSDDGGSLHGFRHPRAGQKFIVISSCAWTETDVVYESMAKQFDMIFGEGHYTSIYFPQLNAILYHGQQRRIDNIKKNFVNAGVEFANNGKLTQETHAKLEKPTYSPEVYKVLVENFWKIEEEAGKKAEN